MLNNYSYIILLMKNTSLDHNDATLISVLQEHLKGELNLARVKLICLFVTVLFKTKAINYDRIAFTFDTIAKHITKTKI